jgi:uncharacterized membrane protein
MMRWFRDRPWLWFAALFLGFLALWFWYLGFASRNAPPPFDEARLKEALRARALSDRDTP